MKKKLLMSGMLVLTVLALTACSGNHDANANGGEPAAEPDTTAEDNTGANVISPLPSGIDLENLNDCTVAVSFEQGDVYVDDAGAMQLKATVYDNDNYDMVDISNMKIGDTITICGQDVEITTFATVENGININGGSESGGYTLTTSGDTVYYVTGVDDLTQYYALGEVTIPVSDSFVFEDSSDLEKGTCTYYPGDFLTDDAGIEYHFVPNNTTITIQDGCVVSMTRVYNP